MFERGKDEQLRLYATLIKPDTMMDMDRLCYWERSTARNIEDAKAYIAKLEEYRTMLMERAQKLCAAPYKRVLRLERVPKWSGSVEYLVTIRRAYDGIGEASELSERYKGSDRHDAFKRFAELTKQNPGIETEKDTERRSWER